MDQSIDSLLWVLSSDCFSEKLLFLFEKADFGIIQNSARHELENIIGDGEDYFMDVDLSNARQLMTAQTFFSKIELFGCSTKGIYLVNLLYQIILADIEVDVSGIDVVNSVIQRLEHQSINDFSIEASEDLIDLIIRVTAICTTSEEKITAGDWMRFWRSSESVWDNYLKRILGEENYVPEMTFQYLWKRIFCATIFEWKRKLADDDFTHLINFIRKESLMELAILKNERGIQQVDKLSLYC